MPFKRYLLPLTLISAWVVAQSCGKLLGGERYNSSGYTIVRFGEGAPSYPPPQSSKFDLSRELFIPPRVDPVLGKNSPAVFTVPANGAVIYAWNAQDPNRLGRKYLSPAQVSNPSGVSWAIPNGRYFFGMVGFPSGTYPMDSIAHCARGSAGGVVGAEVELNGGSRVIGFEGATCSAGDEFRHTAYLTFKIAVCEGSISGKGTSDDCAADLPTGSPAIVALKVIAHSVNEFNGPVASGVITGNGAGHLASDCLPLDANGLTGVIRYVGGNMASYPGRKMRVEVVLFSDAGCTSPQSYYAFRNGMAAADATTAGNVMGAMVGSVPANVGANAKWVDGSPMKLFLDRL